MVSLLFALLYDISFVTMVCILCHTIFLRWQIEEVMNNLVENGMYFFFINALIILCLKPLKQAEHE